MSRVSYARVKPEDEQNIEHISVYPNERSGSGVTSDGDNDHNVSVDYVLVYETNEDTCREENDEELKSEAKKLAMARTDFEKQLEEKGLVLQRRTVAVRADTEFQRHFVLVLAPREVLVSFAESNKLKVPLQVNETAFRSWPEYVFGSDRILKIKRKNPFNIQDATINEKPKYFMSYFKKESTDNRNNETPFETLDRHYLVRQILSSVAVPYGPIDVGLNRLVMDGAYTACYPLHGGIDDVDPGEVPSNDRQRLKRDWARFGRCFKYQPYNAIKDYFGHEIALYFAWLGFYTAMLVPMAIIGLIVFLYGIMTAGSHIPVRDICDTNNRGVWYMCPLCDKQCTYWDLAPGTCLYAFITHVFDNEGTVVLAFVASIWATLFLELWKRRQANLAQEWHTKGFEEEEEGFRPQYLRSVSEKEMHPYTPDPVTGKIEPNVFKIKKVGRLAVVFSAIAFMICLVLAAIIGVIVYRAAVFVILSSTSNNKIGNAARIITTTTSALLNLVAITVLQSVYSKLAIRLTDWENPPTNTAYKDSFTWKMALFQFVNNYTSIFYIAFFKSELIVGSPGRYRRVFGEYRLDSCSEQGCFLELTIQIATIMVGQQILYNITEIGIPHFKLWNRRRTKDNTMDLQQYEMDFDLSPLEKNFMFWEYLEVALLYGFVTMFVAAFPLGPLFALINVIVEIRVDAINFLCHFRRPDPARVEDIGAWYGVLEAVTKVSVLVNAFVLAFTSSFIPKLVYTMAYAPDSHSPGGGTLKGYVNNSLALIDLKTLYTWENGTQPDNPYKNLNYTRDYCRYHGYHDNTYPYQLSKEYWNILAARLAFVFVFQFVVYAITSFIAWIIPDIPEELKFKMQREKELLKACSSGTDYTRPKEV